MTDRKARPMPDTQDIVTKLREKLDTLQGPTWKRQPLPWTLWTSCSFRRVGCDATGSDGDVLHAYNQRSGNHADLSMSEDRLEAWVGITNNLPALLDHVEAIEKALREIASFAAVYPEVAKIARKALGGDDVE